MLNPQSKQGKNPDATRAGMSDSLREQFVPRHLGADEQAGAEMLGTLGLSNTEELLQNAVPADIRFAGELGLGEPCDEHTMLRQLQKITNKNRNALSLIGLGYHDCLVPPVILRCFLENPGWYTAYTPYQAEISQGRLELLLGFQQMITDLTGTDYANASLLDEATAAAEGMQLMRRAAKNSSAKFFADARCFGHVLDVVATRAQHLGIELTIGNLREDYLPQAGDYFGLLMQSPTQDGEVISPKEIAEAAAAAHEHGALLAVGCDPLAQVLLAAPGAVGADVVYGNSQRFGVPLGYGGPHAAFFAVKDAYKRLMPGRLIGVSRDIKGKQALRMSLQTREQHIRREKATSNICTAQVLLANMAFLYAAYHGPQGLRRIAKRVNDQTRLLAQGLTKIDAGYAPLNTAFFDTLTIKVKAGEQAYLRARESGYNLRRVDDERLALSLNETTELSHIEQLLRIFAEAKNQAPPDIRAPARETAAAYALPTEYLRQDEILTHPAFNTHRTETEMMRYLRRLQQKDIGLDRTMIPLGSCTMKLNAAAEMIPIGWETVNGLHPFAPAEQTEGYREFIAELNDMLCKITGFFRISFQPNSGAQGEYAGLLAIRSYHERNGQKQRDVCLIPSSAHGTNPASTVLAGMRPVIIGCDKNGNADLAQLKEKAAAHSNELAALMITYPSTHGVFEDTIREICDTVHQHGGQVYMDGANLNAMVGVARPQDLGADVCHINLHKTFCIPHGGGGPGMGPIGVAEHLAEFLPKHRFTDTDSTNCVSAAPYGSASILPISWAYIKMMGESGLRRATELALLSANYIRKRLEPHYPILYTNKNGYCAHECILDIRPLKADSGITEEDIAKRLIDYGFHAPTMSFPVAGTLMVEPTESESKAELDRFCDAMIHIRREIARVESGEWDAKDNPLTNSPHTLADLYADWSHQYSKKDAFYPLSYLTEDKYLCPVNRIDNVYGDRNLICSCPLPEDYES